MSLESPLSVGALDDGRLRRLVEREHAFVWRSLRRLGVPKGEVDDAVQKVFLVVAQHLGELRASGERAFLFAIAVRVASNERRAEARRRTDGPDALDGMPASSPSPEEATSNRVLLDRILEPLPIELRSVLILFELEGMTTEEIATMLEIPVGTAASRLRRGRELVEAAARRMAARGAR